MSPRKIIMKKHSIEIKPANRGKLHEETGTPAGQKIPLSKIKAKEHSPDPAVRKEAQFADNARKWAK